MESTFVCSKYKSRGGLRRDLWRQNAFENFLSSQLCRRWDAEDTLLHRPRLYCRRPQRYTSGYLDLSQQQPRWSRQCPRSSPLFVTLCRPHGCCGDAWPLPQALQRVSGLSPALRAVHHRVGSPLLFDSTKHISLFPRFPAAGKPFGAFCSPSLNWFYIQRWFGSSVGLDGAVCNDPSRAVLDECWKANPFTWTGNTVSLRPAPYYL